MPINMNQERIESLEEQVAVLEALTSNIAAGLFATEQEAMSLAAAAKEKYQDLVRQWDHWVEGVIKE
jgi:uncharacterized membrane protein